MRKRARTLRSHRQQSSARPDRLALADRTERLHPHVLESGCINQHGDGAIRRIARCEPEGEGGIAGDPLVACTDWPLERECHEIPGLIGAGKPDLIGRYALLDRIDIAQRDARGTGGIGQLLDRSEFDRQIGNAGAIDERRRLAQIDAILIGEPALGAAAGRGPDNAGLQDRLAVDCPATGYRFRRPPGIILTNRASIFAPLSWAGKSGTGCAATLATIITAQIANAPMQTPSLRVMLIGYPLQADLAAKA